MVPVEFQPADASRFRIDLRYDDLGAVRVMHLSATPFRTRRTPALIRRSAPDLLSISMVLSGHGNLRQHGRDAHAEPGTFCCRSSTARTTSAKGSTAPITAAPTW